MANKIKEFITVIITIFLFSYIFNFVWESFHAVFLFNGHNFNAIRYVPMISYVSMIDGILISGMYLLAALVWRSFSWIKEMKKAQVLFFSVSGLLIATWIEIKNVYLLKIYSYNNIMPVILGIGLSPLVQLSITGMLVLFITRQLFYKKGVYHGR